MIKKLFFQKLVLTAVTGISLSTIFLPQIALAQNSYYKTTAERFADLVLPDRMTYFSVYSGPSFGGDGDPVNSSGEVQENSINTWNQVSFQWQATKKTRIVLNPRFLINHNPDAETRETELVDPVVGFNTVWYKGEKLTFAGGINTILPFARTEGTEEDGVIFNPGGFNSLMYQATPRFSFGTWIWGRALFYDRPVGELDERYSFFFSPQVNYQFYDDFSATVFFQFDGDAVTTYRDIYLESDETLNFMTTITINQYLTLQPMITVFRETGFNPSQGNFNLWLSGRFF